MTRIWLIARREFLAAVSNRGFVIGLLMMPALIAVFSIAAPRLMNVQGPLLRGQVAVIDRTGIVLPALRSAISADGITRRQVESARRALVDAPAPVREAAGGATTGVQALAGEPPDLRLIERPPGTDVQAEKAWLNEPDPDGRHVALVVVHADAVVPAAGTTRYGAYDIYVPGNLEERVETVIFESLRETLLTLRLRVHDLDRNEVDALMRVPRAVSVTVSGQEERRTNRGFNRMLPFVFAGLLVFSVMIGGSTLLTQTVEEKSSRVIEVLLAAVSPFELMAGKILGQMAVSLLVLGVYLVFGGSLLVSFALFGLLDPWLLPYLLLFFLIAYLMFASVFGAVGSAVNEVREAQALMTPLMLLLMAPWLFAPFIAREPNAPFAIALSLIPPVNSFAMMIRLASTTPPPFWQVWLSIGIGIVSAVVTIWFAAKVFRIGILMHGKPPNLATLVRWARQA